MLSFESLKTDKRKVLKAWDYAQMIVRSENLQIQYNKAEIRIRRHIFSCTMYVMYHIIWTICIKSILYYMYYGDGTHGVDASENDNNFRALGVVKSQFSCRAEKKQLDYGQHLTHLQELGEGALHQLD